MSEEERARTSQHFTDFRSCSLIPALGGTVDDGRNRIPLRRVGHYYRYLRPFEYTTGPLVQLVVGVAITVIGTAGWRDRRWGSVVRERAVVVVGRRR